MMLSPLQTSAMEVSLATVVLLVISGLLKSAYNGRIRGWWRGHESRGEDETLRELNESVREIYESQQRIEQRLDDIRDELRSQQVTLEMLGTTVYLLHAGGETNSIDDEVLRQRLDIDEVQRDLFGDED